MSGERRLDRRGFLARGLAAASTAMLGGCNPLSEQPWVRRILGSAETLTRATQRAVLSPSDLAREFSEAELSTEFKANGSTDPDDADYKAHAASGFANWKLGVGGLVEQPLALSLDELRAMPSRTQITRHDCVEGWSCIGKWKGVPLSALLERAKLKPDARYIVFYCADDLGQTGTEDGKYYESIGLVDAFHAQTLLAYEMNDQTLPIPHGAPLRLRVERQLGYKMAKYVMRIEAVDSLSRIRGGRGGFWEDQGYEWYAGI
jgi:DMSO/TMAO reductase YedYZ molybdopterin-dependent catalytic subunit